MPTNIRLARVMTENGKVSNLHRYAINYGCKKFYNIDLKIALHIEDLKNDKYDLNSFIRSLESTSLLLNTMTHFDRRGAKLISSGG